MLIGGVCVNAQRLEIKSPLKHVGSVPKADFINVGTKDGVAKIIVELNAPNVTISNPDVVIGEVDHEIGRYEFFAKVGNDKKRNHVIIDAGREGKLKLDLLAEQQPLKGGEAYQVIIERHHDANAPQGAIKISSYPAGAQVLVDGVELGVTSDQPLEDVVFANEEHTISFRKPGFLYTDTVVNVSENETKQIASSLRAGMSNIRIRTDMPDATATIDDESVSLPYKGIVDYGLHQLTATAPYRSVNGSQLNYSPISMIITADDDNPNINHSIRFTGAVLIRAKSAVPGRRTKISIKPLYDSDTTKYVVDTHHGKRDTKHLFEGLYGDYEVAVESYMSEPIYNTIHIGSNESRSFNYELERTGYGKTIVAYRGSLRAPLGLFVAYLRSVWGLYAAGGTNFAITKKPDTMSKNEHRGAEYYLFGIKSYYGAIGGVYNPNNWFYVNLGVGYGEYESAGYTVNKDGEQHDTHYDPVGKYRGVDLDAGIGFSVFKKVYFGFGYNAILGKKITPFFTNLNISIGVVI